MDDIDHLGNRRVRTVASKSHSSSTSSLAGMTRTIRERLNVRDSENLTPQDLVNARTISSVINVFFGTNPLAIYGSNESTSGVDEQEAYVVLGLGGLRVNVQASKSVTFTIHTMAVFVRLKHPKVRTSV